MHNHRFAFIASHLTFEWAISLGMFRLSALLLSSSTTTKMPHSTVATMSSFSVYQSQFNFFYVVFRSIAGHFCRGWVCLSVVNCCLHQGSVMENRHA